MLAIDTSKMLIELTRGDTANIVFSAQTASGETYSPNEGEKLTFAVAKKVGQTPIFSITNTMASSSTAFWTVGIEASNTKSMKFGDYVWDLQLTTSTGTDTIIGKTDSISPTFRVWGEVAEE